MMTDIKFRVWNVNEKQFEDPDNYAITGGGIILNDVDEDNWTWCNKRTIIQLSTGQFDINGIEIYDGDIVQYYFNNDIDNYITDVNLICRYDSHNTWFIFSENLESVDDGYYWLEIVGNCKVMGNVFENPELIK